MVSQVNEPFDTTIETEVEDAHETFHEVVIENYRITFISWHVTIAAKQSSF